MYKIIGNIVLFLLFLVPVNSYSQQKRLLVLTDVGGGDNDDMQSFIHMLYYLDYFDLRGVIVTRPKGTREALTPIIKAYRADCKSNKGYLPNCHKQRLRISTGAKRLGKSPSRGYSNSTHSSRFIAREARKSLLHVAVWGSITDLAQALRDSPAIKKNLKVISTTKGGYNEDGDPTPLRYMRKFHKDLDWIDMDSTARGFWLTGQRGLGKYENVGFTRWYHYNGGELGKLFYRISAPINVNRYGLKMGDTATILHFLNGRWGGVYCKGSKNYKTDCDGYYYKGYKGAHSVARYKKDVLRDWEKRIILSR